MQRQEREKKKERLKKRSALVSKSLVYALVGSLVLHIILMLSHISHRLSEKENGKVPHKIRLVLNSERKKFFQKPKPKQIVDTEQTGAKERAKEAKFYGKKTQKFARQTVVKRVGSFRIAGKGTKRGVRRLTRSAKKVTKTQGHKKKHAKASKRGRRSKNKKLALSDLAMGNGSIKKNYSAQRLLAALGTSNGVQGQTGLSQSNDFVEDIPLGDMTHLNTVEYKYYSFYHRIKKKLEKHWGHTLREKAERLWRTGRRLPASVNRITSLVITINGKGSIVDITVKGTSGVRELDEAAIESFNKAGPFPNPPRGMIKNGTAEIEWGFVVKS